MKTIAAFLFLFGCARGASAPVNYAAQYARAVFPAADVAEVGAASAIGRDGDVVFFCGADAQHHAGCRALADWRPKQNPNPNPSVMPTPPTPAPPSAATSTPPPAPAAPAPTAEAKEPKGPLQKSAAPAKK